MHFGTSSDGESAAILLRSALAKLEVISFLCYTRTHEIVRCIRFSSRSEVISMSVYEALSLMIAFATLIVLVISAH